MYHLGELQVEEYYIVCVLLGELQVEESCQLVDLSKVDAYS